MADNENLSPEDQVDIEQEIEVYGVVERPTDRGLSIDGMAADAKATGDAIRAMQSEIDGEIGDLIADMVSKDRIDTTLAVAGGVAEAKAVGDAIAAMKRTIDDDVITNAQIDEMMEDW